MNIIELEKWTPSVEDPRRLGYAGQRTAQEVFEELKHRLESTGYIPDGYFLLDREWENGREIPRGADIFCTTDYGGSEGVYLDVYLKWYDQDLQQSVTKSFITGKSLGENGNDLDRMFLVSSAITKAFHGDHATHARYRKIDFVEDDTGGAVVHLSHQEQKVIIEALVEQRERQEEAMSQTEQLLRRMTGSITEYINEVGLPSLRMSDYDKAVLAIRDGNLEAFKKYAAKVPAQESGLLVEAAGRPGAVGRKMTELLVVDRMGIDYEVYHAACKRAIDIADSEKTFFLLEHAQASVHQPDLSLHGEMAGHAFSGCRALSREILRRCTDEQIAAAPSYLLTLFANGPDDQMLDLLVEKGISGGDNAARALHMLTYEGRHSRLALDLLRQRMWVNTNDYNALHVCVENDAVEVCKLLLDNGINFDRYQKWAAARHCDGHEETLQALAVHWQTMQSPQQEAAPGQEGMTFA